MLSNNSDGVLATNASDLMRTNVQRRMAVIMGALGAGCVFQIASCADLGANTVGGLLSSISGEFIRNMVNELLGLGGGMYGF